MSTKPAQNGDGPMLSRAEPVQEGMNDKALLRAMYTKMNQLEFKLDKALSAIEQISTAVHCLSPKPSMVKEGDYEALQRHSSSYLVVNSHNHYQDHKSGTHSPPATSLESAKVSSFFPPTPQSPIYFSARTSESENPEHLATLKEGTERQTAALEGPRQFEEESSDDSEEEEDDDDDDSESSASGEVDFGAEADDMTLLHELDQIQMAITVPRQSQTLEKEGKDGPQTDMPVVGNTHIVNFGLPAFTGRAESPLPVAETCQKAGYGRCKRKRVAASDDNRVKFFENVVQFCTEEELNENAQSGRVEKIEPQGRDSDWKLESQSSNGSGGFIPNNQLISTSGFKNDHGTKDNRFVEEAHSDTLSFLTTLRSDLQNMKLIQNGLRTTNENSTVIGQPPVTNIPLTSENSTVTGQPPVRNIPLTSENSTVTGQPHVANTPLSGSMSEVEKLSMEDNGDKNCGRVSPSVSVNSKVGSRSGSASSTDTVFSAKANGRSTDDEEKDTLVGDAFIQALLQTQKKEAEANTDPKSQGLDTVICLDLSMSMTGQSLQLAKEAVLTFLEGIESAAVDYELEENVALVTFGKENKVQQHLTNNYDGIRDKLELLEAGGPSPLWLGLALSLTELNTRGGCCRMNNLSVLPRIILVSDGFATKKNKLTGMDMDTTNDKISTMVQNLVAKNTGTICTLDCITTGVNNTPLLSEISDGRVFTAKDLPYLTEFFRVKDVTNVCLSKCKDMKMTEQEVFATIQTFSFQEQRSAIDVMSEVKSKVSLSVSSPGINDEDTADAPSLQSGTTDEREVVSIEIQKNEPVSIPVNQVVPETNLSSMDSGKSSQFNEGETTLPAFGTWVSANPDWEGYENNKDYIGTVIGSKKDRLKILWPDGEIEKCCYGDQDQYDVRVIEDHQVDNSTMRIGAKVQRGKDWRWKDQDGGVGNIGVVLTVDKEKKVVHVVWPSGTQGNYRNGYKNNFDLEVVSNQTKPKQQTEGGDVNQAVWQIEQAENEWQTLPMEVSQSIEDMYTCKPKNTFLIKTDSTSYRISLVQPQARDLATQQVHAIRRIDLPGNKQLDHFNEQ